MANDNRIVRVRNDKLHDLLDWCADYCDVSYQIAFEEWCRLMTQGYVNGSHTNVMLVDRIRQRVKGQAGQRLSTESR